MTFTFSKGPVLVSIFLCFFANAVYASEKFTGASLKKEIISHAHQVGITLKPIISEHKVFYPCHEGLSVGPKFDSWETIEVSCKLPYAWKLVVRSKVFSGQSNSETDDLGEKESFSYVVFDKPVKKGTILTKDSLIQMANFSAWVPGAFSDKQQLIGRKLAQSVPAGIPVLARHLTLNYAVEKNSIIDIILSRSGIEVTGKAVALSDGQIGEVIIVSNLSSGAKLKALIKNGHQAQIISKQLN